MDAMLFPIPFSFTIYGLATNPSHTRICIALLKVKLNRKTKYKIYC